MLGKVKWFNNANGYGFITDSLGCDIFVHYSVIQKDGFKTLKQGDSVEYEKNIGPKGDNATIVYPQIDNSCRE